MATNPDPQPSANDNPPATTINSKVGVEHLTSGRVAGVEFENVQGAVFNIYTERAAPSADAVPARAQPDPSPRAVAPNPFEDAGRIDYPAPYLDRMQELQRVFDAVKRNLCVSVVAGPKMGRSSLLSQVAGQGPSKVASMRFALVDLQECDDAPAFYATACEVLGGKGESSRELRRLIADSRRVVLCLDGMEQLNEPGFDHKIRAFLRGMADGGGAPLKLVTGSRQPLVQLFPDDPTKTEPLYDIFTETVRLTNFSRETCDALLDRQLANTGLTFDAATRDELWTLTQGHPYKLQRAAHRCYEAALNPNTDWRAEYQQDVAYVK